ncbi:DUF6318 family protein [Jatrophihabitans sp.]|jgi:cytoskeletal protein RodZ|uniref:DUF6318 family protein n=1 Tax=Jatrophihabitans sp. TaxID=1932789 RepID=UPI002EE90541
MALLGAVALLVTGCTGDAAPNTSKVASSAPATSTAPTPTSPTPTSPTPASPTPASPAPTAQPYPADVPLTGHNVKPGEKPPLYPAAAKARTQAGANAFAEFYMRTLDWAYATTNPSYLKHYSAASCGLCTGLATGITRTATQRHRYLGGRLTIHPATTTAIGPATAPADYCSIVTVDITAQSIVDRTGEVVDVEPAHPNLRWKVCAQSFTTLWRATYLAGAK